jgi:hypothetical protein
MPGTGAVIWATRTGAAMPMVATSALVTVAAAVVVEAVVADAREVLVARGGETTVPVGWAGTPMAAVVVARATPAGGAVLVCRAAGGA